MTMPFKIVVYNIFQGGIDTSNPSCDAHPSSRLNGIAAFLRSLNPTVTILTELNNFDSLRFSNFANQWNHPHTAFLTAPTGFHLGVSSSFPLIELAQMKHDMHHGALLVQVNFDDQTKIGLVATHLNPYSATARTIEAKIITDQLKKQDLKDWIIAGDLNSLSEHDAAYYEPPTKFTATRKLKDKFLTPDSNSIDYTTINHFIQQGYIDTLRESDQFRSSVPTKLEVDPMHALQMRLDYILATKELTEKLVNANILDNETTAFLSDHYPVMASFLL
jgi:exodeoxyribonuclease-3